MSERPIDPLGAFELRLGRGLRALSDPALRSVDATELAHELATTGTSSRLRRLPGFRAGRQLGSRPAARVGALLAAAVVVAVGGVGLAVLRQPHGVAANPTPTSTPSASKSLDRAVVDLAQVQSSWTSNGTRKTPFQNGSHVVMTDNVVDIMFGPTGLSVPSLNEGPTISSASLERPGSLSLQLRSTALGWNCTLGDEGTYELGLSSDGQRLTLTPVQDTCAVREAILGGEWRRTDLGRLSPGTHDSLLFRPFGASGTLTYAVPAQWEVTVACASCFALAKVTDPAGLRVNVIASVVPTSLGVGCKVAAGAAGSTPAGIAAWLATLPNLAVATPTAAITIGGLRGVAVDLTVRPDSASLTCRFLDSDGGDVTLAGPEDPFLEMTFQSPDDTRIILLDRGDGNTMAIVIAADYMGGWAAELAEAMKIVQSFELTR